MVKKIITSKCIFFLNIKKCNFLFLKTHLHLDTFDVTFLISPGEQILSDQQTDAFRRRTKEKKNKRRTYTHIYPRTRIYIHFIFGYPLNDNWRWEREGVGRRWICYGRSRCNWYNSSFPSNQLTARSPISVTLASFNSKM